MAETIAYWAGEQRTFRLTYGGILDLEEACGRVGIGEIFVSLGQHRYKASYVFNAIKLGLVGGGLTPIEAERIVKDRWDHVGLGESAGLAVTIIADMMEGVTPADTSGNGEQHDIKQPFDAGEIFASFLKAGFTPKQVREMQYADFINMSRALGREKAAVPTMDEYNDMIEMAKKRGMMDG